MTSLLQPGQKIVDVGGEPAVTMSWGNPKDPAILLIHGFGGNAYSFRLIGERLAEHGYYVIACDLRGYGATNKSWEEDYSHSAQAAWIADIAETVGVTSAITIAHSMGANISLQLMETHPNLVKSLIVLDGAFIDPAPFPTITAWTLSRPTVLRLMQHILRNSISPWVISRIADTASAHLDRVPSDVRDSFTLPLMRKDWDLALLKMIIDRPKNQLLKLPEIDPSRLLILWGEEDVVIPISVGEEFRNRIAREQNRLLSDIPPIVIVPDSGHLIFLDQPEKVTEAIVQFLAGIRMQELDK